MIAVYCDANEVVKLLLQSKANLNDVSLNGSCAGSLAISSQNIEIFELLMKYGIDINQPIHNGLTPLMYAIQNECITMVNKLLQYEGIDVNALSEMGDSALSVACEVEDISMVKLLSEKGADSNLVVGKNNPLCMVASLGKLEIAEYLIEKGAKVNPSWQPSPITLAMLNKQDDMVKLLLEKL